MTYQSKWSLGFIIGGYLLIIGSLYVDSHVFTLIHIFLVMLHVEIIRHEEKDNETPS